MKWKVSFLCVFTSCYGQFFPGPSFQHMSFSPQYTPPPDWEHWPAFLPLLGGVSSPCLQKSLDIIQALTNSSSQVDILSAWQMLDSIGKYPRDGMFGDTIEQSIDICEMMEGLRKGFDCQSIPESLRKINLKIPMGHSASPGNIEECLKNQHIETRYCKVYASTKSQHENETDLRNNYNSKAKIIQVLSLFPEMEHLMPKSIPIEILSVDSQQVDYDKQKDIFKGTIVDFFSAQVLDILEKNCPECQKNDITDQLSMYLALLWLKAVSGIWFGGCYPSVCSTEDINKNYAVYTARFHAAGLALGAGTADTLCIGPDMQINVYRTNHQWSNESKVIVPIFCVLGFFIAIGTFVDIFDRMNPYKQDLAFSNSQASKGDSFGLKIMKAFSLYSNGAIILDTQTGGKDVITCLHGIRFLSMTWVVLGHTVMNAVFSDTVDNSTSVMYDIFTGGFGISFEAILNAFPSVDTFFVLSGFLVAYLTFKELDRTKGVLNHIIVIVLYYVHRYIRLTIPLTLIMWIIIGIHPLVATGVDWSNSAVNEAKACSKYWKDHIGYYNNEGQMANTRDPGANSCMGVTWYMANDMMFFWMAPLLMYPMWYLTKRLKNVGIIISIFLWFSILTAFTVYRGYLNLHYRVGLQMFPGAEDWEENTDHLDYYYAWFTRTQPYLVGLMLGYILHLQRGRPLKLNPVVNVVMWQVSFLVGYSVVFGLYDNRVNGPWPHNHIWIVVAYNTLQRLAWGLSVAWVIFSCSKGFGGPINDFLSWKFFGPLSKLTYCTYLIHMNVVGAYFGTINYSYNFTWWNFVINFLGCLSLSLTCAFILTLTVELPFIFLEKLLVGKLLEWIKSVATQRAKEGSKGKENGHTVNIK